MSAFGTKRTWRSCSAMSAFGGKADIAQISENIRFLPDETSRGLASNCAGHEKCALRRHDERGKLPGVAASIIEDLRCPPFRFRPSILSPTISSPRPIRFMRNCAKPGRWCGSMAVGVRAPCRSASGPERLADLQLRGWRRHRRFPPHQAMAAAKPNPRGRSATAYAQPYGDEPGAVGKADGGPARRLQRSGREARG